MLKFAIEYRSELSKRWIAAIRMPRNRYLTACGFNGFNFEIKEDDFYELQMVSVNIDFCVIGYFSCSFDRTCKKASDIIAINFSRKNNIEFARDMRDFLDGLFTVYGMNKIEWNVVVGNPAEAQYDRVVKRYGGRVVGVKHDSCCLVDGTLCDLKLYELMRRDYMAHQRIPSGAANGAV